MKVVVYSQSRNPFWIMPENHLESLRRNFPQIRFIRADANTLPTEIANAEIYFGYLLPEALLEAAAQLKWIHVAAANVFPFIKPAFQSRNLILTNARGAHATAIAEHILGSIIVFARKFVECWRFQQQRHYAAIEIINEAPPLSELRGKTTMILGLGGIGKTTARLCKAFGMRVLAVKRRSAGPFENIDEMYGPHDFRKALPEADYLVISTALTPETEGLLGREELGLLKPDCVIINVARAPIIDHDALLTALREKRIRGAALDVFEQEPLPEDSELWTLPNVFLTPHVAGVATTEHWPRMLALFEENLRLYLKGKPLKNVVDLHAGY
jgi:phosphoglycerate dehydrogenase-like enzyme